MTNLNQRKRQRVIRSNSEQFRGRKHFTLIKNSIPISTKVVSKIASPVVTIIVLRDAKRWNSGQNRHTKPLRPYRRLLVWKSNLLSRKGREEDLSRSIQTRDSSLIAWECAGDKTDLMIIRYRMGLMISLWNIESTIPSFNRVVSNLQMAISNCIRLWEVKKGDLN